MNQTHIKIIESDNKEDAEMLVNEFTQRVREQQYILINISSHITDRYTFIVTYKSL